MAIEKKEVEHIIMRIKFERRVWREVSEGNGQD
jgi:hypothetical protein